MSVGCLEPQFYAIFMERLLPALPAELTNGWKPNVAKQFDRGEWPKLRAFLESGFMSNTRDYWANVFHSKTLPVPVLL